MAMHVFISFLLLFPALQFNKNTSFYEVFSKAFSLSPCAKGGGAATQRRNKENKTFYISHHLWQGLNEAVTNNNTTVTDIWMTEVITLTDWWSQKCRVYLPKQMYGCLKQIPCSLFQSIFSVFMSSLYLYSPSLIAEVSWYKTIFSWTFTQWKLIYVVKNSG